MEKNDSNLKYKEGDVVVLLFSNSNYREVRRITGLDKWNPYDYYVLESVQDGEYHMSSCYENNIEGLYEGKIDIDGDVWEPKFNIGDTILVHVEGFGDKPTWHTIYYIDYSVGTDTRLKDYNYRQYNIGGDKLVYEKDVLDVIRYGETK